MARHWTNVSDIFEALSSILNPFSPNGIELFFTTSYNTWRRHNTTELVTSVRNRASSLAGVTDVGYRLRLQLESYAAALRFSVAQKKKKRPCRPLSVYVLTDGAWQAGSDPRRPIRDVVCAVRELG